MKVRRNPDAKMDLENVKALKINYSINLCRFVYILKVHQTEGSTPQYTKSVFLAVTPR